ncbi:MAG: response regulator transcription factor [Candidatus Omnitrophica bacterium]|nr:response regulator transcription factor [Candidatus Omnitrophota bacterium]
MSHEHILVVEDEPNISQAIQYNLEKEGYRVSSAGDGAQGLKLAQTALPSLVVLDLMLPQMDGLEICRLLKREEKTKNIPILMVTAKSQETDKVVGLELGADDYLAKPFSMRELIARVKAILRRSSGPQTVQELLVCGTLKLDLARRKVTVKEKEVVLTAKEFDLLRVLMEAKGRVLDREKLLERIWGLDRSIEIETRTVDVHVGQLRRKIGSETKRLVTLKGVGYRWDWD